MSSNIDRSAAVNLAKNLRADSTKTATPNGVLLLVEAVLAMDKSIADFEAKGDVVAVTSQDKEGRILSVIAKS